MQEFGIQIEWTMTGQSRTTTSRRKELCTWYCVCVQVNCSSTFETIESQQEELHRAQVEELHRRDHQLLHEQLLS